MKKPKYKLLKVTIEEMYIIPMLDEERTEINGWDIDTVIQDWFKDYPLDSPHAARDAHKVGNSGKLLHTEFTDLVVKDGEEVHSD